MIFLNKKSINKIAELKYELEVSIFDLNIDSKGIVILSLHETESYKHIEM
jgi:hypothetical protein